MADPSTREVVRGYYEAWTSRDLDRARGYLADDLDFQGTLRRYSGADNFIPALGQFLEILEEGQLLMEVYEGENAMMLYDSVTGPGARAVRRRPSRSARGRSARSSSSSIRPS